MVTRRHKDRVQINNLNSQILQVIQFIHNSLKVTAIKFTDTHNCRYLIPLFYLYTGISNVKIFSGHNIVGRITVQETVYVNLIHDRTLRPLRGIEARIDFEIHSAFMLHTDSQIIIIAGHPSILDLKIITEDVLSYSHLCRIIIKSILCLTALHLNALFSAHKIYRIHIVSLCTELDHHCVTGLWFCRASVIFCSVTEKRLFVKYGTHV